MIERRSRHVPGIVAGRDRKAETGSVSACIAR